MFGNCVGDMEDGVDGLVAGRVNGIGGVVGWVNVNGFTEGIEEDSRWLNNGD